MKLKLCIAITLALTGCKPQVIASQPQPRIRCEAVKLKTARESTGCMIIDGSAKCYLDFLQPRTWGRCLQEQDDSFDCENQGVVSHYAVNASSAQWSSPAASCSPLTEQIRRFGQEGTIAIPMPIPLEPRTPLPKGKI